MRHDTLVPPVMNPSGITVRSVFLSFGFRFCELEVTQGAYCYGCVFVEILLSSEYGVLSEKVYIVCDFCV